MTFSADLAKRQRESPGRSRRDARIGGLC